MGRGTGGGNGGNVVMGAGVGGFRSVGASPPPGRRKGKSIKCCGRGLIGRLGGGTGGIGATVVGVDVGVVVVGMVVNGNVGEVVRFVGFIDGSIEGNADVNGSNLVGTSD